MSCLIKHRVFCNGICVPSISSSLFIDRGNYYSSHKKHSSWFGDLITLGIVGVIIYAIYKTCLSDDHNTNGRASAGRYDPHRGSGTNPPPPGFRSEYMPDGELLYQLDGLVWFGFVFTAGVQSTTGGYVFTGVCLSTGGEKPWVGAVPLVSGPWSFHGDTPWCFRGVG